MAQPPLSEQEVSALMVAEHGSIGAIGSWEKPVLALIDRGFLRPMPTHGDPEGKFNTTITELGRNAIAEHEKQTDQMLADVINKGRAAQRMQKALLPMGEQAAQLLADMARQSVDSPKVALVRWVEAVRKRAEELLGE